MNLDISSLKKYPIPLLIRLPTASAALSHHRYQPLLGTGKIGTYMSSDTCSDATSISSIVNKETPDLSATSPWPIVAIATSSTIAESTAGECTTGVPISAFCESLGSSGVVTSTTGTDSDGNSSLCTPCTHSQILSLEALQRAPPDVWIEGSPSRTGFWRCALLLHQIFLSFLWSY